MSVDSKSTRLIGFATEYFTLWNMAEIRRYEKINNLDVHVWTDWVYTYRQNLSKSEEQAIEKFKKRFGYHPEIDDSLRGQTSSFTKTEREMLPYTVFPFGKLQMVNILESDDAWQLNRVLSGEGAIGHPKEFNTSKPLRRRVLARKRLIELGEIIKFKHLGDKWDDNKGEWINNVQLKYISKIDYEHMIRVQRSSWLHENGEKVELSLQLVKKTGYESSYGYIYIIIYKTRGGQEYTYKGSTPPNIEDEFTRVTATIKNGEYRQIKQNLIQRVKILS
jgi:hypothetical protein